MMTFDESTNSLVFNRIKNPVKDLSPYVLDDIKASYNRMLGTYNKVTKKFEGGTLLQECDRFNETLMADGQCSLIPFGEALSNGYLCSGDLLSAFSIKKSRGH